MTASAPPAQPLSLFESIPPPSVAERARACALPPLLAYIALQLYLTVLPIFGYIPIQVLRFFAALLALAGAYGFARTLRLVSTEWSALDFRSAFWIVASVAMAILSLRTAIAFRFYRIFSG